MKPIIEIRGLSKKYTIQHQKEGYVALRDIIAFAAKHPLDLLRKKTARLFQDSTKEEYWALKDVDLSVERGDVVGIIGSNGAGKSTLLKILSQITPPTSGEVRLRGRVGSLLEVGTGFHPELSGRENIFLNGSILGMSRREIQAKFDRIVEFAGVQRFLDTAVKRYSSGMYVRLAFSVAAHLEPDILIIDEVLAVGDAEFQKKCLGKMEEVTRQDGRTILFVSHNMGAVRQLCKKAALLEGGRLTAHGLTGPIIEQYLNALEKNTVLPLETRKDRKGSQKVRFTHLSCHAANGEPIQTLQAGAPIEIRATFETRDPSITELDIALGINCLPDMLRIGLLSSKLLNAHVSTSSGCVSFFIDRLPLNVGRYTFTLFADHHGHVLDWVQDALQIQVDPGDFYPSHDLPSTEQGPLLIDYRLT